MGEPLTKKIRVWNPALDESLTKEDSSSPSASPTQPLDYSKPTFPSQIPMIMQVSRLLYLEDFFHLVF